MVLADKRDYKKGYRKHYSAYKALTDKNSAELSRRLLLDYSVECGLKYKLLDSWEINTTSEINDIIQNKNHPKHSALVTHNLQKMLKELGQEGQFKFPQIKTIHKDNVSSEEFHEMQRYGIKEDDREGNNVERFEKTLIEIASWLEEEHL